MRKILLAIVLLFMLPTIAGAQKVGLVLSGGGARGLAHVGVIKALEENNIPMISGNGIRERWMQTICSISVVITRSPSS